MTVAVPPAKHRSTGLARMRSPLVLLAAALVLVTVLLSLPLSVPIGPMYWDVFIYYDAANRIFSGQVPVLDFFTPVGPLGYYLFAFWLTIFPNGQPALMAHWSILGVTAPLMALVLWQVDHRSRVTAFALLAPFLLYALLPFNTREFYPYPGSDAFGIYNRQACLVLYVLVSSLLFVRSEKLLAAVVTIAALALFFLKITGFVAAMIICLFAFAAGRIRLRAAMAAAIAFLAVIGVLELTTGLVTAYVADILALLEENSGTLLPRFVQAASLTFGIVAPAGVLILVLIFAERRKFAERFRELRAKPGWNSFTRLVDQNAFWLAAVLAAGIFFETQNTGSQALIFIWPVLFSVLLRAPSMFGAMKTMIAIVVLALAASLPSMVNTIERAARAYFGALNATALASTNLRSLGTVNARPNVMTRAEHMLQFYPKHLPLYDDFIDVGELPAPILYSDFDFQIVHLLAADKAVSSIQALEAAKGVRFETMMTLSFVNIMPWLMDRQAPRHIAIGADPFRAVPEPGGEEMTAVSGVDIALYPKCPSTTATARLLEIYAPALKDHTRISLDACFDAFIHPRLAGALAP